MTRQVELITASRTFTLLNDVAPLPAITNKFHLGPGSNLWSTPPLRYQEQVFTGVPGSRLTPITHKARDIVLPIKMVIEDSADLETTLDQMSTLLDPVAGEAVTLQVTRPDASTRSIPVRIIAGLDSITQVNKDARVVSVVLVARADAPYWEGAAVSGSIDNGDLSSITENWSDVSIAWSAPGVAWSAFNYETSALPDIDGDFATWLQWTIEGPCTHFAATQTPATVSTFSWRGNLLAGETLVIETDPAVRSALVDGVNAWSGIVAGSTFWDATQSSPGWSLVVDGADATTTVSWVGAEKFLRC